MMDGVMAWKGITGHRWFGRIGLILFLHGAYSCVADIYGWTVRIMGNSVLYGAFLGAGLVMLFLFSAVKLEAAWNSRIGDEVREWYSAGVTLYTHPATRVFILGCISILIVSLFAWLTAYFAGRIIAVTTKRLADFYLSQ